MDLDIITGMERLLYRKLNLKLIIFLFLFVSAGVASYGEPKTRAEEIEEARKDKVAHLWPERESPLVDTVNGLVERGLKEGFESGKGANGWQIVMGGTRSGQGAAFGGGYRRTDIWQDRLGFRTTGRGTFQGGLLFDFDLDFQGLRTERTFVTLYTKYERSPQMDFYGEGQDSSEDDRTSYLLEDFAVDANAGFEVFQNFKFGLTAGVVDVHTDNGRRSGVPSFEDIFDPLEAPGLGLDTTYYRWGAFIGYDNKDYPSLPRKGGLYGARFRLYSDRDLDLFNFRQTEFELQQYIPYFNKTRVIAIRLYTVLTFASKDDTIPVYFEPTLGGNEELRGFQRYRFQDDHAIYASVEHRWYAFTGLEMAVFVDAGKVVPEKAQINFSNLDYSAGIGFRFRINNGLISRIDLAGSREGFRFMWTFSDVFKSRYR